jgi:spermidine synthase
VVLVWLLIAGQVAVPAGSHGAGLVIDSPYGRIELQTDTRPPTLRIDGINQAALAPLGTWRGTLLRGRQYVELLPYLRPMAERAVVIGLGGGVVSRVLTEHGLEVLSLEINAELVALARRALGFDGEVLVGDGRRLLRGLTNRSEFIVLDVFHGEAPPPHLFTREAFAQIRARLLPEGVLSVHLIGRPASRVTVAVANTLATVFAHRLCLRSGVAEELQDLFLLASDAPLQVPPHPDLAACGWLGNEAFTPPACDLVLTDDHNPLDLWNEPIARELRLASRVRR